MLTFYNRIESWVLDLSKGMHAGAMYCDVRAGRYRRNRNPIWQC